MVKRSGKKKAEWIMPDDIKEKCVDFLSNLPNLEWDQFRSEFSKLVTEEKNKRIRFCVLCTSDIDQLETVTRFKGSNLRSQIKSGHLQISPSVFKGYVCDEHSAEYNLPELIDRYIDWKAETDSAAETRQAQIQIWKHHHQAKKDEEIKLWIDSRGRDGKASPHKAFVWLLSEWREAGQEIGEHLSKMPYKDFLKTKYWFIISSYVKYKAGYKCALCPSKFNLHAHHKTYQHRGREIEFLGDLIALCNTCHARHHEVDGGKHE